MQWTFSYPPNDIAGFTVSAGTAASAAGKSIYCNSPSAGVTSCLLVGLNATNIADGVIASADFVVSPNTASGSAAIQVFNVTGASPLGDAVPGLGAGAVITILPSDPALTSLTSLNCSPSTVTVGGSTQCTVAAAGPAGPAGLPVSLGYSTSSVVVRMPTGVTIPLGATTAGFLAQLDTPTPPATVVLTATANSSTKQSTVTVVSLSAPAPPQGLHADVI